MLLPLATLEDKQEARNLFVAIRFYLQDFIYKCSASNMSIEARERLRKQRGTPVFGI